MKCHFFSLSITAVYGSILLFVHAFAGCTSSEELSTSEEFFSSPNGSARPPFHVAVPQDWNVLAVPRPPRSQLAAFVYKDSSAIMVLREMIPIKSAQADITREDICVLGNVSLQAKMADVKTRRRILRTPARAAGDSTLCWYIYAEQGLSRRVIVFRTNGSIYEVELLQKDHSRSITAFFDAQNSIARRLVVR